MSLGLCESWYIFFLDNIFHSTLGIQSPGQELLSSPFSVHKKVIHVVKAGTECKQSLCKFIIYKEKTVLSGKKYRF